MQWCPAPTDDSRGFSPVGAACHSSERANKSAAPGVLAEAKQPEHWLQNPVTVKERKSQHLLTFWMVKN